MGQPITGITMEEYEQAKGFQIKDLDNDTYVKFGNNAFVLDRYEGKKPYFITGDDGKKKRMDMYSLQSKTTGKELGTIIYYTNENGTRYTTVVPNNAADAKVWNQYFEDIHAIDKKEQNFILKLSYVLSIEFSYQAYKSTLKGKEVDRSEAGTYGNDICFTGNDEVALANGTFKKITDIKKGDMVVTVDPLTLETKLVNVNGLTVHEAKNYVITTLTLISAKAQQTTGSVHVVLQSKRIEATPNHPIPTTAGVKNIGNVSEGDEVLCNNTQTGAIDRYVVWQKTQKTGEVQQVYNIEAGSGSTFLINGVVVYQKLQ